MLDAVERDAPKLALDRLTDWLVGEADEETKQEMNDPNSKLSQCFNQLCEVSHAFMGKSIEKMIAEAEKKHAKRKDPTEASLDSAQL